MDGKSEDSINGKVPYYIMQQDLDDLLSYLSFMHMKPQAADGTTENSNYEC